MNINEEERRARLLKMRAERLPDIKKQFEEEKITNYDYQSIDGTYIKSNNSKFNVIHEDDLKTLLNYYETGNISDDEIEQLRKPAYKLYKNEPKDINERIKLIKNLIIFKLFDSTAQNKGVLFSLLIMFISAPKFIKKIENL